MLTLTIIAFCISASPVQNIPLGNIVSAATRHDSPDIRRRLSHASDRSKTRASLKLFYSQKLAEQRFRPIILNASRKHHVDPNLIKAVIMAESGFNPRAISRKGARGLMQLMPETAAGLGVRNIFDPRENIHGGAKYLKHLKERFGGELELALAAYHAGSSKVLKAGGIPPIRATERYIRNVFGYYRYFMDKKDPSDYNLVSAEYHPISEGMTDEPKM